MIETLHNISLTDLWFYNSLDESEKALTVLVHIFKKLTESDLNDGQRELLIKTIIKFMERLVSLEVFPRSVVWHCLELVRLDMHKHEEFYLYNSGYFKTYLNKVAQYPEYRTILIEMTSELLGKCIDYWEKTSDVDTWLREKNILFHSLDQKSLQDIEKPFFDRLRLELAQASQWEELCGLMFFNDISNYFRSFTDRFGTSLEKIYYLHFLLHLPGMALLKDHLLYDLNRYLRSVLAELDEDGTTNFLDTIMVLFNELKEEHAGTVLDCILTLGKEIIRAGDEVIISYFVKCLIQLGFNYPGRMAVNSDWQIKINANHVKNIKVWLELIEYSPNQTRELLEALIVNLKLGGIFISDTDLFQREITKLLNSDIAPVYREMKQLARIFPVYFREIGAEGKLREATTAVDEISRRQDKLIHFLRKQIHTESNNTHIALSRQIIRYWYDGDAVPLKDMIPEDVYLSLDTQSEWYTDIHEILSELCSSTKSDLDQLFEQDVDHLKQQILKKSDTGSRDRKRLYYLFQIHSLLLEKYSLESEDILTMLKNYRFFTSQELSELKEEIKQNETRAALTRIYGFMGRLKEIILDPKESIALEDIYYKTTYCSRDSVHVRSVYRTEI